MYRRAVKWVHEVVSIFCETQQWAHGIAGGPKGNLPPGGICGKDDERVQDLEHSSFGLREAQGSDREGIYLARDAMQACEP